MAKVRFMVEVGGNRWEFPVSTFLEFEGAVSKVRRVIHAKVKDPEVKARVLETLRKARVILRNVNANDEFAFGKITGVDVYEDSIVMYIKDNVVFGAVIEPITKAYGTKTAITYDCDKGLFLIYGGRV